MFLKEREIRDGSHKDVYKIKPLTLRENAHTYIMFIRNTYFIIVILYSYKVNDYIRKLSPIFKQEHEN